MGLRTQLMMLQKKEDHLNKKIEDETKKAKANVTTNKRGEYSIAREREVHAALPSSGIYVYADGHPLGTIHGPYLPLRDS